MSPALSKTSPPRESTGWREPADTFLGRVQYFEGGVLMRYPATLGSAPV
jgi:hypothetical protein